MATLSLELNKILKAVATISAFSLALFLIAEYMVDHPTMAVKSDCRIVKTTNSSCEFECKFNPECKNRTNARIIVLHFNWDAIYDNRTEFICNTENTINIEIPKRSYNYLMRGAFYNGEYGVAKDFLQC